MTIKLSISTMDALSGAQPVRVRCEVTVFAVSVPYVGDLVSQQSVSRHSAACDFGVYGWSEFSSGSADLLTR